MEVNVKLRAKQGDVAAVGGPAVVVNLYQGVKRPGGATAAVDEACGGVIARALETGDFRGRFLETAVLYPRTAGRNVPERVVLVGLGDKAKFDLHAARKVGATLANVLRNLKVKRAATALHGGDSGGRTADLARALAEGVFLGAYRYNDHFQDGREKPLALEELTVVERLASRQKGLKSGLALGEAVGRAVIEARELANGPSNRVTPTYLADRARSLGRKHGFKVKVMDEAACKKAGMGAFLGVAQGSEEPCRFIVMEHEPKRARGTVCLVGKGITFDTGGISLKPAQDMDQMKLDMSGAAAVIGTMQFVASQKLPLKVVGLVAATENMPGGKAYKPGDVLTSMAGVTIEVLNTDAEGRLVLADALAYAEGYEPDAVIDLATLTGACVIALGPYASGIMGNDEWLLDRVHEASQGAGELAWPLPLLPEYRDMVKGKVADIKNTAGRAAGAITAGAFLGAFTNHYRWVHMDIAGTAWGESGNPLLAAGGSGAGVRTLAETLLRWKPPRGKGPKPGPRTSLRELPDAGDGASPGKPAPAKETAAKRAPARRGKKTRKKARK